MRALITGGAGYIGSILLSRLLAEGHEVIAVDKLLFGGDSLLPFLGHPARFTFERRDQTEMGCADLLGAVEIVYHLAAIVGFPACRDIGEEAARRYNVDAHEAGLRSRGDRRGAPVRSRLDVQQLRDRDG